MASRVAIRRILTHGFSDFLRRRHAQRHFARRPLLDTLVAHSDVAAVQAPLANDMLLAASDTPAAAIARLRSHENGLSQQETAERLAQTGPNEIAHEKPLPAWRHLWRCYLNPFNLSLTVLAGCRG